MRLVCRTERAANPLQRRIIFLGGERPINPSESAHINCPYCGEPLEIVIDASVSHQEYVEDCQVCCKPMKLRIRIGDEGEPNIEARSEDA